MNKPINWDKPIELYNGVWQAAVVISKEGPGSYPIVVKYGEDFRNIICLNLEGKANKYNGYVLIRNKVVKKTAWVNIYRDGVLLYGRVAYGYSSKAEAKSMASPGLISCIPVEYEE